MFNIQININLYKQYYYLILKKKNIILDCNKTSEKFFDFTGDTKDSEKFNKKIGQFILDEAGCQGEAQLDGNVSQILGKGVQKNLVLSPQQSQQQQCAYNYQTQRDLKSYLIKKSSYIMSKNSTNQIVEQNHQVEVLQCIMNGQQYEVQILPVIIDFQLSIALQFHLRQTKGQLEKSHYNFNNQNNIPGFTSPKIKRESFSKYGFNKKINSFSLFNGLTNGAQSNINQNTPLLFQANTQMNSNINFQFLNDEKDEEIMNIVNFYQMIIKLISSHINDLIAALENTGLQSQNKLLYLEIQGLKQLKSEQKLLSDAINLKANYIKSTFQNINSQNPNSQNQGSVSSNQMTGLTAPVVQYHQFDFSELFQSIKHHLFIHGYDFYFNVKSNLPSQYQIFSNKELIQSIIHNCIYLIAECSKLKSMHQQQQTLMRIFTSSGSPLLQNNTTNNVNNIINALNNPHQVNTLPTLQLNQQMHKMIIIEFSQVISSNAHSNINVKITNIQHPIQLDQPKNNKLSSFFINVLKMYIEKVGIPASLSFKQNDDNLRYSLTFTILSDCNSLQTQQQQLTQQFINASLGSNRQYRIVSEYVNTNTANNHNTLKDRINTNVNIEQYIETQNSERGKNPTQTQQNNIFHKSSNDVTLKFQMNDFNETKLYEHIEQNNNHEDSDCLDVNNESQCIERKFNNLFGKTGVGSAQFTIDSPLKNSSFKMDNKNIFNKHLNQK